MSRRERRLLRRAGKKHEDESPQGHVHTESVAIEDKPKHHKKSKYFEFYEKNCVKGMYVTFGLLIIALIIVGYNIAANGELFPRGVSLKGGVSLTILDTDADFNAVQEYLNNEFPQASISVRSISSSGSNGISIDASDVDGTDLLNAVQKKIGTTEKYSMETMGSSLGAAFFRQTLIAMVLSFIFMAIVVFISFRSVMPSIMVILAAFSDIVMTIAVIIVTGMKIETAGIAAILMLIGYSVDTDILLTTRVLKREGGTVFEKIAGAMNTGLLMTFTAIIAVVVALIFTNSDTVAQIMTILLIGLLFDILNTWIQNAGLLYLYLEKKK
jgi:preprotein translocase subunit SecF